MEQDIKQTLAELLKLLGVTDAVIETSTVAGQTVFQTKTKDSRSLIGMRGETLKALDYVVKKMVEKDGITNTPFVVDVEGYRIKEIKDIEQKALMMAERARSFKYDVELTPMSAYERLIVHAALSGATNIKTESRGEGFDRRVVIRYVA